MGIRTIRVCDCCGKELKKHGDIYHIDKVILCSETYTDSAGDVDYNSIAIELCKDCAEKLVQSLDKIVQQDNC